MQSAALPGPAMDKPLANQEAGTMAWGTPMNGERTVTTDDSRLVARFLQGDASAFDALFLKYQDYVYNILYGIVGSAEEARDLTQEVFLQVYKSLGGFRQGARFATWLYRIAVNRGVDAARGSRRWRFLPLLDDPSLLGRSAPQEEEPEFAFERSMEREAVQTVLMRCPLAGRDILVLRYYQGLSVEEIAETVGCTVAAAKVRLHRARQTFKENYIATYGVDASEGRKLGSANTAKRPR